MKFSTAHEAFEWAIGIYESNGNPRSLIYDRDHTGKMSIGKDYQFLDSLSILFIAEKHDRKSNGRGSWFIAHFMPDPTRLYDPWSFDEMEELVGRIGAFSCELVNKGLVVQCEITTCGHNRGRR